MTIDISNNAARINYTVASGVTQTSFSVPFEFFNDSDLSVYVNDVLKTITTHYTVSGGDGSTGTITMSVTGASGGSTVVISRSIAIERTSDFQTGVDINRAALNTQLDTLTAIASDNEDKASRAISAPNSEVDPVLVLPDVDGRKGRVLGFNATTGNVEAGPNISDVSSLAAITADIATLADIEDGTDATDAIQTVAGISSNVTTVAGVSANVTTVAGNTSNINTVAGNNANITTVAGIDSDVTTVSGISSDVTTVAADGTDIGVVAGISSDVTSLAGVSSEISLLGTTDAIADMNILGTAAIVADMDALGPIAGNITTVAGISSNVTTVAGISSDVTAVAANATDIGTVAGQATQIGLLGTADAVSDMNTLAVSGIIANMETVSDNISVVSYVGDVDRMAAVIGVAINASNINTVAADGADIGTVATSIASVNTAATNIASINTNATNITDIQNASANAATATTQAGIATTQAGIATTKASEASASEVAAEAAKVAAEAALDEFTDIYLGAKASDPATDNDGNALTAGDQYFNTTINVLKIYNGSAWQAAAIDSSGFVETTGDTMTGDLSFGDGDKAIFGAGSDLQIYHDGSNSYIDEAGTGSLWVRGNDVILGKYTGEYYLYANADGALNLYYDGTKKLNTTSTGIDVTGTVTADGLTVDGDAAIQNISDGFRTLSLSGNRSNSGVTTARLSMQWDGNEIARIQSHGGADTTNKDEGDLLFYTADAGSLKIRQLIEQNGDISFYEDTGTTPKFFWDASAERLGIGTSSPSAPLHVNGGSSTGFATVKHLELGFTANRGLTVSTSQVVAVDDLVTFDSPTATYGQMAFKTAGAERLRIDSSGNVGIGTDSPNADLELGGTGEVLRLSGSSTNAYIRNTDGTTNQWYIGSGGNAGLQHYIYAAQPMTFHTSGLERLRIDSSGNIFSAGKTVLSDVGAGHAFAGGVNAGLTYHTRDNGLVMSLSRLSSDGDILRFVGGASSVGSIGTEVTDATLQADLYVHARSTAGGSSLNESRLWLLGGDSGIVLDGYTNAILPTDENSYEDNRTNIGSSDYRFKDLYLSGGVYLGGTGSANKLDDYETGTWTPVVRGGTTAGTFSGGTADGRYIKIGEMITLMCYIDSASLSGAAGIVEILGNPFTSAGSSLPANAVAAGRHSSITLSANAVTLNAVNVNNNTLITLRESYDDGTAASILDASQIGSSFGVVFSLTFRAA
jgi:hypothetical protein